MDGTIKLSQLGETLERLHNQGLKEEKDTPLKETQKPAYTTLPTAMARMSTAKIE